MISFLTRLDRKSGTALIAAGVSFVLTILKLILWLISSSVAIKADAFHSASDTVVSLIVFSGLRVSESGARRRPWVESLVSIGVALLILYAAGTIFSELASSSDEPLQQAPLALAGIILSILISRALGKYKLHVGRETSSPSILADGYHSMVDSYSSIAVAVGLVGAMIGLPLERLAASIVSILVVGTGLEVLSSGIKSLFTGGGGNLTWSAELGSRIESIEAGEESGYALMDSLARAVVTLRGMWEGRSRLGAGLLVLACVLLYLLSGLHIIGPDERGVKLLFGEMVDEALSPGLHYRAPRPFGNIAVVKPDLIQRIEIGFRSRGASNPDKNSERLVWESRHRATGYVKYPDEAIVLTGDENLIDLSLVMQYRISDVKLYLYSVKDPELLMRNASQASVRAVVGGSRIDSLLTTQREDVEFRVASKIQILLDRCKSGIHVDRVWLKEVHPPVEVVNSFREVASAREDRSRIINEAITFKNGEVPKAHGEAYSILAGAAAYKTERLARSGGEAAAFLVRAEAARKAPGVTRTRLFLETIEKVLPGLDKFITKPGTTPGVLDLRFLRESTSTSKPPLEVEE